MVRRVCEAHDRGDLTAVFARGSAVNRMATPDLAGVAVVRRDGGVPSGGSHRPGLDEIVKQHAGRLTVRHAVHAVVPTAVKQAGKLAPIPGVGFAGGWAARYVLARAMPLPPPPGSEAPEAALSMARRSMSALMT
jgi:hypothetical protein